MVCCHAPSRSTLPLCLCALLSVNAESVRMLAGTIELPGHREATEVPLHATVSPFHPCRISTGARFLRTLCLLVCTRCGRSCASWTDSCIVSTNQRFGLAGGLFVMKGSSSSTICVGIVPLVPSSFASLCPSGLAFSYVLRRSSGCGW